MKGITYRSFVNWIRDQVPGGLPALSNCLHSEQLRHFVNQPFLAATWYDNGPIVPLYQAAAELLDEPVDQVLARRGRTQAVQDLSGIYSWALKLASPKAIAQALARLTERYFDWGEVHTTREGPGHVRVERHGVPSYLTNWYVASAGPYIEYALEKSSAKNTAAIPSTRAGGMSHGQPCDVVIFDMTWA